MLLLQEDRTYGKGLHTKTGGIIKAEEGGPGKVCLYYTTIKALTKEQRESFTKMVMEDKDEKDF
jgi:hypothetical protein